MNVLVYLYVCVSEFVCVRVCAPAHSITKTVCSGMTSIYLWQANCKAEPNGSTNVVSHPEVDSVDTTTDVNHSVQNLALKQKTKEGQ